MSNLIVTQGYGGSEALSIASVTLSDPTTLVVTFNDSVLLTGYASDASRWLTVPDSGGIAVTVQSLLVAGNTVTLTTTEHTDAIDYTLTIPTGVVGAGDGAAYLGSLAHVYAGVGTTPYITIAKSIDTRTIDVVFSEAVVEEDALDPANYVVVGPNTVTVEEVTKVTDQTYRLTTTPQDRTASYNITVSNVRDLAQNEIATP